jgi:hypothetical protein
MSGLDAQERLELCDLFDELGPSVPNLIAGWTARDLAAPRSVTLTTAVSGGGDTLRARLTATTFAATGLSR